VAAVHRLLDAELGDLAGARDALVTLLGTGQAAIGAWETLDQEGMLCDLIPGWDRVRNRPQRNPLHIFTVDRHLVETAARAAALTRDVARPDLLLIAALLHDIGKGWPGDHRVTGEVVTRQITRRMGLAAEDTELVARAVRHHLLLPHMATRRDLDDPQTAAQVAAAVGGRPLLELLHALAIADGRATGPAAWNDWKAGLVAGLVRRVEAVLGGGPPPVPPPLRPGQAALAEPGQPAAMVTGSEVTVVAPDRPGLLWQAAGVLAAHRLAVRSANATTHGAMAVTSFTVAQPYGEPPDAALVTSDLRRALAGDLDVAELLKRQGLRTPPQRARPPWLAPPKVTLADDASRAATVVEVRAHDAPGLLWRIGRALGDCGLDVRAASSPAADFAEIAWGDCACSLYTRREGRQRAVKFVEALLERGLAVQLLLYQDGETFNWEGQSAERVSLEAFRLEALRILPEGRVAEIVPE